MKMAVEEKLAPQEVSRRIVTGMGLVYDLFNELTVFFKLIRDGVESSALDARPLMGRRCKLGLGPRKNRTAADGYLSTDMGLVFELGTSSAEDEDEETDDDDDTTEAELEKKGLLIIPESQFLAIRVALYDRNKANDFSPTVFAAPLRSPAMMANRSSWSWRFWCARRSTARATG